MSRPSPVPEPPTAPAEPAGLDAPAAPASYCRQCGYALRGLAAKDDCPECGRAFDRPRDASGIVEPREFQHPWSGK